MVDYDHAGLKELAKELDRPLSTLAVLARDPFTAGAPARKRDAEWFAELWRRFDIQPGAHLRRIHYVLVSQEPGTVLMPDGSPYLNTDSCYNTLNTASLDARYLGLVPANDLVDRRNAEPVINASNEEEEAAALAFTGGLLEHEPPGFEVPQLTVEPPKIPQRFLVEIWCEKSTMNDILMPLGERYGINIITAVGEMSLTRCVELVARTEESQRPVRILYVSDFDPAGESMPVAVARKIEHTLYKDGHDLDIQVRPVVLTHDQCERYHLPRTPLKDTETRAANFEARYGEGATELDALEALHPGELERILTEEIGRYYDNDLAGRIEDVTEEVQGDLDDVNAEVRKRYAKELRELETERKKTLAAIKAFEEKAKPLFERIEHDLEDEATDADAYDWPEPDEGDEDDDPLFDSTRDYVEQIDRFKEHQGKPTERRPTRPPTGHKATCIAPGCGKEFIRYRSNAKTCSDKCRSAAQRARNRGEAPPSSRGFTCVCDFCGDDFTSGRRDATCCGKRECQQQRQTEQRRIKGGYGPRKKGGGHR
jgi:hypothetical protein